MKKRLLFLFAAYLAVASCTKDKTDYEAEIEVTVPEDNEFKEAAVMHIADYTISMEALSGSFYIGYNEVRLKIKETKGNRSVEASKLTFLPIFMQDDGKKSSCPHKYNLSYDSDKEFLAGYSVFTESGKWTVHLQIEIDNKLYTVKENITVHKQSNQNLNMTAFTGRDDEQYFIALIAPRQPKVAENELIAGIYRYNRPIYIDPDEELDPLQYMYTEVEGYTLQLDPRMPEPSMGNHSSPNNKDLTQQNDGLYHGVVNYTMTGNWTLNFILLNQNGKIIKGTEVPKDFTPGVEGVKSELYIDTLF